MPLWGVFGYLIIYGFTAWVLLAAMQKGVSRRGLWAILAAVCVVQIAAEMVILPTDIYYYYYYYYCYDDDYQPWSFFGMPMYWLAINFTGTTRRPAHRSTKGNKAMKIQSLEANDHRSHPAPFGADPTWQDAWMLVWCDPINQAGGFHHVDLRHVRNRACVWSWIGAEGKLLGHFEDLDMELPDSDLSELKLGPLAVTTHEPMKSFQVAVNHGDATADLRMDGFTMPPAFEYQTGGMALAPNHYEAIGRVTGSFRAGEKTTEVLGFGIHDHSWGPRDYGTIRTHRFLWAGFGPDLCLAIMTMSSDETRRDLGWIYDRGEYHPVVKVSASVRVGDDGLSPIDADTRFWTASGEGYRMTAKVHTSSFNTHEGGYFMAVGLADFELGGRLGAGMVEIQELARPNASQRTLLERRG